MQFLAVTAVRFEMRSHVCTRALRAQYQWPTREPPRSAQTCLCVPNVRMCCRSVSILSDLTATHIKEVNRYELLG